MEVLRKIGEKDNFLQGMNVRPGSMSIERAFALLGGSNEAKQTAENTRRAAEILNRIDVKIAPGTDPDDLTF